MLMGDMSPSSLSAKIEDFLLLLAGLLSVLLGFALSGFGSTAAGGVGDGVRVCMALSLLAGRLLVLL